MERVDSASLDLDLLVVVPTHRPDNIPYLRACLDSLVAATGFVPRWEILVVSDHPTEEHVEVLRKDYANLPIEFLNDPSLDTFAKKINHGTSRTWAKDYLWASDDTLFGHTSIREMVRESERSGGGAIINCDGNWEDIAVARRLSVIESARRLAPDTISALRQIGRDVWTGDAYRDVPRLIRAVRLNLYATLVPRQVIETVGLLDENYVNGWEDADFNLRCHIAGIRPVVTLAGFVYHHGSLTVSKENTPKIDDHNERYYNEKWKDEIRRAIAYL